MFDSLPESVQRIAERRFDAYCKHNPRHPALEGKKVRDKKQEVESWSVKINYAHRALAMIDTDPKTGAEVFVWYWIGSHEDYNNRV